MDYAIKTIEGTFTGAEGARVAIVAARFNEFIVARLIDGALDTLRRHGVAASGVTLVRVPGAWELASAAARLAHGRKFDAIIALGAVIRGSTPHFDYVASESAKGLASAAASSGVPLAFGVLTTDTIEQAIERAGTKAGNKGADAALVALEMISLGRALTAEGL